MAAGNVLKITYKDAEDATKNKSFSHAKSADDLRQSEVTALMNAMVTNTAIFDGGVASIVKGELQTTTIQSYEVPSEEDGE